MNTLITYDQMAKELLASMKKTGIIKIIKKANKKERAAIIRALMNTFGARMP